MERDSDLKKNSEWMNVKRRMNVISDDAREIIVELKFEKKEKLWADIRQPDGTPQLLLSDPQGWISWQHSGVCSQRFLSSLRYFLPYTLRFPPTRLGPKLPGGLLNVFCPSLKCCAVLSTHASQNPSLWFALLSLLLLWHLTLNMKTQLLPAPPQGL